MEPTQEDVDEFRSMIGIILDKAPPDENTARRFLKDASNAQEAINEFERNPNKYHQDGYDETLFSQDRDGGSAGYEGVPSFQIDHAANYPASTVATRPNTPSNSIHDSAMGDSQTLGGSRTLQKPGNGQESGVVGGAGAQFGPANRPHYDADQWALTTVSNLLPDPPASERKRAAGEPAFLKPLPSQDYLPSLITILHSIPLARDALLLQPHLADGYGSNSEWWQGTPVITAQTIDLDNGESAELQQSGIIHETQRLMAFLDNTQRSYGSAEALSKLDALKSVGLNAFDQVASDTDLLRFLLAWEAAALKLEPDSGIKRLFQTTATESTSDGPKEQDFRMLRPVLDHGTAGPALSLYDVLDDNLWASDLDGDQDAQAYINTAAEVFVLSLKQPNPSAAGLNMVISSEWYVDRYLAENAPRAKKMRQDRAKAKGEIKRIRERQDALLKTQLNGKEVSTLELLETSMTAFKPAEDTDGNEDLKAGADEDTHMTGAESQNRRASATAGPGSQEDSAVLKQLQKVFENVKQKAELLKAEEARTEKALQELSNLWKSPSTEPSSESDPEACTPRRRYRLCGLSTDPCITYLKDWRYQSYDDEGVAMGEGDGPPGAADWWRIQYEANPPRVKKNRISEDTVLQAAATENREVFLVYASDAALEHPNGPLPKVLDDFVKRDNLAFLEELSRDEPPPYQDVGGDGDAGVVQGQGWSYDGAWGKAPEMEEKGAGLVAEMVAGQGEEGGKGKKGEAKEKDGDAKMGGEESVQHVEFVEENN